MANKKAAYNDKGITEPLAEWWDKQYPATTPLDVTALSCYGDYLRDGVHSLEDTLDYATFRKCLVATGVVSLGGGRMRRMGDYEPSEHNIERGIV